MKAECPSLATFRQKILLTSNRCIIPNESIPNYLNNSETPISHYNQNKPIRSTIFNFNKIVADLDIDSNTPDF